MTGSPCAMCRTGHHCCTSCQSEHWPHGHHCAKSVVTNRCLVPVMPNCIQPGFHRSPTSDDECHDEEKKVCVPGFTGLYNQGNTCFLNSVIQSLSNTRELRDYFHDRVFRAEINYNNPLGTGGRLAGSFATLLRDLWKGTDHALSPSKLKAIVVSKASQFAGYAQHDAQEFMAFLLDGLHEDLNRIQNKPYTETVDSDGRPDEVVAEEAWQRHKMRNDSFIMDLFKGQFKSKLVCPTCSKVSITFDPFLYLPVPLPQKQRILTIFYFAKEPHKKPITFLVSVSMETSSTAEVLESISRSVRIKPENLRLAEVVNSRFKQIFRPSHSLKSVLSDNEGKLLCIEVLSKELAKERVVLLRVEQRLQVGKLSVGCENCGKRSEQAKPRRCIQCNSVAYCSKECQVKHWTLHKKQCQPVSKNVGLPFLVSVPESQLTYARLTQLLKDYAIFSVNVSQLPFQSCSSQGSLAEKEMSCEKAVCPEAAVTGYQQSRESASNHAIQFYIFLDSNSKDQKLKEDLLADQAKDITLELVWKNHEALTGGHVMVRNKKLEFDEDPGSRSETARARHCTLDQCLNLFTKPEVLAPAEAWNCPKCQQHREASKQLLLWRMPNVLIIQLKRFSFPSFIWRDKINDMVHFPVNNLDLSKFCIGQKEEMQPAPVYDLYAVINHYGGMIGGHYTAYARLPSDKDSQCSDVCWRQFDDRTVTWVEESQVVTRYAYVLFYRRRNSPVERPSCFLAPLGVKSPTYAGSTASQGLFGTYLDPEEVD